jgi:peptidoglycan/xylan/chitin deacetylase (PgdA/CDA1 family)
LRDGVFDIPRYGSINLHSGKTPEYRGAAPAFGERHNGESAVGITIHRVAAALDAGDVLRQELARDGFELGAHTCNHVDLGVVAGVEAEHEIADSGARLESEVGSKIDLFSYPYGRKHQITEENRQAIRDAGYACCVSAYGGVVLPSSNLYDLRRVPIAQWHLTTYQFGFEAMTMK